MNKNKILKCVIFQFTVLWQSPDLMSHKLKSIVIKQFDRIEKKKIKRKWGSFCRSKWRKAFDDNPQKWLYRKSNQIWVLIHKRFCFEHMEWDASVAIQPVI